jgi:hypothetical protein
MSRFDDVAKGLAGGVSRREAMRRRGGLVGAAVGAVVGSVGLGLGRRVVRRVLVQLAVPKRPRCPASGPHQQAILAMHAKGKSIKEISTELGVNFATVYRVLRRTGRVQKKCVSFRT